MKYNIAGDVQIQALNPNKTRNYEDGRYGTMKI